MARFHKVMLMVDNYDIYGTSRPSLGLGYLSESLKANGIEHNVLDLTLLKSYRSIIKIINEFRPDLIGVSVFTLGHLQNYELINKLKQSYQEAKFIVGGPHISALRETVLLQNNNIDFAITNEAENAMVDLCKGKTIEEIPKLIYRSKDGIKFNAADSISEKYIADLDSIPWPKYEKFQLNKYIDELFITTSRGCPYKCLFCAVRSIMGPKVRTRSIPNVIEELSYWYKKGRRVFNFIDDNLTFYYDRIFELCDGIEKAGLKGLTLRASNGIRADKTDRKMLKRMKDAGFKSVAIGVDGANEKMMKILGKQETLESVEECIKNALDLDYEVILPFVYGAPGETKEDIQDLIKLTQKYPVFKVDVYNLVPFPGTPLWDWVEKNNAWTTSDPLSLLSAQDRTTKYTRGRIYPFFTTKELTIEDKIEAGKKLRNTTLKIQYRAFLRKLSFLGPLKYIIAYFMSTIFFNKLLFHNNSVRNLAERLRYRLKN